MEQGVVSVKFSTKTKQIQFTMRYGAVSIDTGNIYKNNQSNIVKIRMEHFMVLSVFFFVCYCCIHGQTNEAPGSTEDVDVVSHCTYKSTHTEHVEDKSEMNNMTTKELLIHFKSDMDNRLNKMDNRLNKIDNRLNKIDNIDDRLNKLENLFKMFSIFFVIVLAVGFYNLDNKIQEQQNMLGVNLGILKDVEKKLNVAFECFTNVSNQQENILKLQINQEKLMELRKNIQR